MDTPENRLPKDTIVTYIFSPYPSPPKRAPDAVDLVEEEQRALPGAAGGLRALPEDPADALLGLAHNLAKILLNVQDSILFVRF